jgi:hypothetical protein
MNRTAVVSVAAVLFTTLTACSDQMIPTQPSHSANGSVANASKGGGSDRGISLMDGCDHASFAAQGIDCSRNGGVSFDQFIAEVQAHGSAGAWHMAPGTVNAPVETALDVMNRGGEVHTFTEVKHFGGGIIPILNQLSGNPVPAPECMALEDDDFVSPGGVYHDSVDDGTTLYQCCIHPWMRTVVTGTKG